MTQCAIAFEAISSSESLENPPAMSAHELNELLLTLRSTGNVVRRRFMDVLRVLADSKLYTKLGFSSIAAYAEKTFADKRSQVYEFLRVSTALSELPAVARAFETGELSFSLVVELTRVATSETEDEWLELVREPPQAASREIKDAIGKKRTRPRKDGFGLPGLATRHTFELAPEEQALFETFIEKARDEMGESLDGARLSPKEALLAVVKRYVATDPLSDPMSDRVERDDSGYRVVVSRCKDYCRATVETSAGPVEISSHAAERLESGAEVVAIDLDEESEPSVGPDSERSTRGGRVPAEERDRPNTPALRAKLRAVAAERCENPMCRRRIGGKGHGHHVVLRSEGGRTSLVHEDYVCVICHALAHTGALTVDGDRVSGFQWRVASEDPTRKVRESLGELVRRREARLVESLAAAAASGVPDARVPREIDTQVDLALRGIGYSKAETAERVTRAAIRLASRGTTVETLTVERVLAEALRSGA